MTQTTPKIAALLLSAFLLCAFSACGEESPSPSVTTVPSAVTTQPDDNNPPSDPASTAALNALTAAAEKTQSAKSFVITYGATREFKELDQFYEDMYTQTVTIDENGTYTSILESDDGNMSYYSGNEGYGIDTYIYPTGYIHYISPTPFGADRIFSDLNEIVLNPNFLTDFCSFKPAESSSEGTTEYRIDKLQVEQLFELLMGKKPSDEDINMDGTVTNTGAVLKINAEGYLSELSYGMQMEGEVDGTTVTAINTVVIRFSDINKDITITAPEWSESFYENIKRGYQVHYCENGYEAVYFYDINFNSSEGRFTFSGMAAYYDDELVVPVYKVLDNIRGIPVIAATDVCENSFAENVYIEKLILPVGVCFGGVSFSEPRLLDNTELYFERAAGYDENDHFVIIGEENPGEYWLEVKAAYYAGEWEYVNGIPTPKA